LIAQRHTGIQALDSEPPGEFNTFAAAVQLLSEPDIGATPALRSALYKALASLPGVTVIDSVTDSNGRSGIQISLPASNPMHFAGSFVENAIVDPATSDLLDWSVVYVGPSSNVAASSGSLPIASTPGSIVYSFSLLHSGIVASNSAAATG
jgi:hypothetical protein